MSDVAVNAAYVSDSVVHYAQRYGIAVTSNPAEEGYRYQLVCDAAGKLTLSPVNAKQGGLLCVDFESGASRYRLKQTGIRQALPRAVGCKPGVRPKVLDATAGLAVDAFVLASVGCSVTLIEQNPVVYALLKDGVERAHCLDNDVGRIVRGSMTLLPLCNAVEYLQQSDELFDVVYLDPMFAGKQGSAKVKKGMQYLQAVVGIDLHQEGQLLNLARSRAGSRVVVKRSRTAPLMAAVPPSYQVEGKTIRYDIYLKA